MKNKLVVPLGIKKSNNKLVNFDFSKTPHILISGEVASGKTTLLNNWICSLMTKTKSEENIKFILMDFLQVEFLNYNGIKQLIFPVILDVKEAIKALDWVLEEIDRRFHLLADIGAKNIETYNQISGLKPLPYIFIFIDEFADLAFYMPEKVEEIICRITQFGKVPGIHLVIATQRPHVRIFNSLIKLNSIGGIPLGINDLTELSYFNRIAFKTTNKEDSKLIIGMEGAEKLLGHGDMLYLDRYKKKPIIVQGVSITEEEINKIAKNNIK